MVQPIDYTSLLRPPDIGASVIGGLQTGQAFKAQEQQKAQAEQYSEDLRGYLSNPTAQGAAAMIAKHPKQREAFAKSWEIQSKDQQDSEFAAGTKVYGALQSGRPDAAVQVIDDRIAAMQNSGQDTSELEAIKAQVKQNPKGALGIIGLSLSSKDPDRWAKVAEEMRASEQAPYELTEKQAKAQKAAVDAKFAESMAVQDLAKKGWDIQKIQNDIGISRQNSQIAAMTAGIKRETNDLKRQELQQKVQDAQLKRDGEVREKVAGVETGRAAIDNMLNSADRILKTPAGVISSAAGPISSKLPTLSSDTADLEELVNTMASQAFMAQIPNLKGMGALSNAEGEKLQSSLQNLSLRQSPERLIENVQEAQRLMLKARSTLADRYGVPDVMPDRPGVDAQPASSGFKVLGRE